MFIKSNSGNIRPTAPPGMDGLLRPRGPLEQRGPLDLGVRQENQDLRGFLDVKVSKGKKDREGLMEQEGFREPRRE